jgi:hypothetical protein
MAAMMPITRYAFVYERSLCSSRFQRSLRERRDASRGDGGGHHITDFERLDRRVKTACISFLASSPRSDRSTPQKLFCGSTDSMPACSSLEVSSRIHSTRNFAFFAPRCKLMIVPGCIWVRRAPSRAPTSVISIVCARWVTLSIETLTGNTIFLRGDWRLFNICPDDCPVSTQVETSYLSH